MRDVVMVMETLKEDLVGNAVGSRRFKHSKSNMLGNTNAPRNDAPAPNDQSSSTF